MVRVRRWAIHEALLVGLSTGASAGYRDQMGQRKKRRNREAQPPVRRAARPFRIVAGTHLQTDRQVSDPDQLADHEVNRHGPLPGVPVIGGFEVDRVRGLRAGRVRDERLQERSRYVRAIVVPGKRPKVVGQRADRLTAHLFEHHGRGSRTPFAVAEKVVGGAWIKKLRT